MRLPALAIAACGLVTATIAVAQISARPNPIRIAPAPGPVHQQANTAGGDGRAAAQIGELQAQISALDKRLGQTETRLAATQGALTSTQAVAANAAGNIAALSTNLNALEGKLAVSDDRLLKLRSDFAQHNHFYRDYHEEAGKLKKLVLVSSRPTTYCERGSSAAGDEWTCSNIPVQ